MRHAPGLLQGAEAPAVQPLLRGSAVWAAAAGVGPQAHADPRVFVPGCVRADQVGSGQRFACYLKAVQAQSQSPWEGQAGAVGMGHIFSTMTRGTYASSCRWRHVCHSSQSPALGSLVLRLHFVFEKNS